MPDWRHWGFSSYEAWIESKAGASPPECVTCGGDGETGTGATYPKLCRACGGTGRRRDWPMPKPPPHEADDEGLEEPRDA